MKSKQFELLCTGMATLLNYPQSDYHATLEQLLSTNSNKTSAKALQAYRKEIASLSLQELQEVFTRTFDLTPLCSPALSVHLFGVESFKRSHLMVGLLDMYREAGFTVSGETADHMSTVLRFLAIAPPEVRNEVAYYILIPALTKMTNFLESKKNLFAHLLSAASALVVAETGKEAFYA